MKTIYKKLHNWYSNNLIAGLCLNVCILITMILGINAYGYRHINAHKGEKVVRIISDENGKNRYMLLEDNTICPITTAEYVYINKHAYQL